MQNRWFSGGLVALCMLGSCSEREGMPAVPTSGQPESYCVYEQNSPHAVGFDAVLHHDSSDDVTVVLVGRLNPGKLPCEARNYSGVLESFREDEPLIFLYVGADGRVVQQESRMFENHPLEAWQANARNARELVNFLEAERQKKFSNSQ